MTAAHAKCQDQLAGESKKGTACQARLEVLPHPKSAPCPTDTPRGPDVAVGLCSWSPHTQAAISIMAEQDALVTGQSEDISVLEAEVARWREGHRRLSSENKQLLRQSTRDRERAVESSTLLGVLSLKHLDLQQEHAKLEAVATGRAEEIRRYEGAVAQYEGRVSRYEEEAAKYRDQVAYHQGEAAFYQVGRCSRKRVGGQVAVQS